MGAKGVWVFQRWLRDQVAADVPLDEFARTSSRREARPGATRRPASTGPTATRRRPPRRSARSSSASGSSAPAATTTRSTSGPRTTTTAWPPTSPTSTASRSTTPPRHLDKHEINGDEIVYLTGPPRDDPAPHRRDDGPEAPRRPERRRLGDDPDALDDLADWLTRDNPQFARNLANRVWFHLMGRGIVDPVDDFRDSTRRPTPPLLDALTAEFVRRRDAAQAPGGARS